MRDDLTVEKLKINERLGTLEITMGKVLQAVDELKGQKNEIHQHLITEIATLRMLLYGDADGKPGLILSVDRLKTAQSQRNWQIGIVYTVLVGLAINQVWIRLFH